MEGVEMSVGACEEAFGRDPAEGELQERLRLADRVLVGIFRRVEHHSVGADHARHILGGFHPPLDLQRGDARLDQLRDHFYAGKIVGG
jgi:hypothetical protein